MENLAKKLGQGFVNSVFSGVHNNYDKANDAMSLFLHRKWKKDFVNMLGISSDVNVVDIASGTGDIAKLMLKKTNNVQICDINPQMLEIAKQRLQNVQATICDAAQMPFENETFNLATCVFGIRNFQEIERAICEVKRILKPHGKFAIMEFLPNAEGEIQNKIYQNYLQKVLPYYDNMFKNEEKSYEYLANSILAFPKKEDFASILKQNGFNVVTTTFMQGCVGIFICNKNV